MGLNMNLKNTNVMYNNHLVRRQMMIVNEAIEIVEEYTILGQMVSSNLVHEKQIRRLGMG